MDQIIHIKDHKVTNRKTANDFFLSLEDGSYVWSVKPLKVRSLSQNAYYHGCCVPAVKQGLRDIGYDDIKNNEQAHEFLKNRFLKRYVSKNGNPEEVIELPGSTANLTTTEFMDYIAEIQKFAAEWFGVVIPDPNSQTQLWD